MSSDGAMPGFAGVGISRMRPSGSAQWAERVYFRL